MLSLSLLHQGKEEQEFYIGGFWNYSLQTGRTSPPWLGKAAGCVLDEACSMRVALHYIQQRNQLPPVLNQDGRCGGNRPWSTFAACWRGQFACEACQRGWASQEGLKLVSNAHIGFFPW